MKDVFDNIILNENALFFKTEKKITKKAVAELLKVVSADKINKRHLYLTVKENHIVDGKLVLFSAVIFRISRKPSFIKDDLHGWKEEKYAYLMLIEYADYCVVIKRNAANLAGFQNEYLIPIDYETLVKLYISERTEYRTLSLDNTDPSEYATRKRMMQSNNLRKNTSPYGMNRYIVGRMKVANGSEVVSLSMNTSRISKAGEKIDLPFLFEKIKKTADKITLFKPGFNAYIDNFAKPLDFATNITGKKPVGILFLWGELYEKIETKQIERIGLIDKDGKEKTLPIKSFSLYLRKTNVLFELTQNSIRKNQWDFTTTLPGNPAVFINKKSISVKFPLMNRVILHSDNGTTETLKDWIKRKRQFIVCFDQASYIYYGRKIFQDTRLLGSVETLRDVFITKTELSKTTSEKGKIKTSSKKFDDDCVFGVIANKMSAEPDVEYMFCDDLGVEWADFIAVKNDCVCIYHAKSKDGCGLSASAFQEVIGQAQKNLGNTIPDEERLAKKEKTWGTPFRLDKKESKIPRLIKGDNLKNGLEAYRQRMNSPIGHHEIYLVVDFISKERLFKNFVALAEGKKVEQKEQVIQLLWFINSYVNSCREIGFKPYVICQE